MNSILVRLHEHFDGCLNLTALHSNHSIRMCLLCLTLTALQKLKLLIDNGEFKSIVQSEFNEQLASTRFVPIRLPDFKFNNYITCEEYFLKQLGMWNYYYFCGNEVLVFEMYQIQHIGEEKLLSHYWEIIFYYYWGSSSPLTFVFPCMHGLDGSHECRSCTKYGPWAISGLRLSLSESAQNLLSYILTMRYFPYLVPTFPSTFMFLQADTKLSPCILPIPRFTCPNQHNLPKHLNVIYLKAIIIIS